MIKSIYVALLFFFSLSFAMAQNVKPYIAVIKTEKGKQKGILYKVDSASVILNHDGEFITIPLNIIKTVQIRTIKKGYKGMNLIKIGTQDPDQYKIDARGKLVDKWGKEAPTLEEEAGITFFSVIFTAIANAVALPIHAINPNLARFNLHQKEASKINELSYYSIYYQANPNVLAELQQLKSISSTIKR